MFIESGLGKIGSRRGKRPAIDVNAPTKWAYRLAYGRPRPAIGVNAPMKLAYGRPRPAIAVNAPTKWAYRLAYGRPKQKYGAGKVPMERPIWGSPKSRNAGMPVNESAWRIFNMSRRKGARVGAHSVGLAGLWDALATTVITAATYRLNTLQSNRAEANKRLDAAREAAAIRAQTPLTAQVAAQPPTFIERAKKLPIIPLAIGGVVLAGGAFFLLKKRGR